MPILSATKARELANLPSLEIVDNLLSDCVVAAIKDQKNNLNLGRCVDSFGGVHNISAFRKNDQWEHLLRGLGYSVTYRMAEFGGKYLCVSW